MDESDWKIVRSTPPFDAMPNDVARGLVGNHGPKVYDKGVLLFQQGEPAEAFYIVLDGWVKVYRVNTDGDEAVLGVFSRGEVFAEAAMFIKGQYPASAEIVAPSRLIRIDGEMLRAKIREDTDIAFSMLASAYHHLKMLVIQIEQIKLLSGAQRVADFLVHLCPCDEGACVVGLPYEKALIANRLGMKPESFSRAIAKLRPFGVTVERDHVAISDVKSLVRYAETGIEQPVTCDQQTEKAQ